MTDNEAASALKVFRRRLCMLRLGIYGAVSQHPDSWPSVGILLGETEELIAGVQELILHLEPGAEFPVANLMEPGPTETDPVH